MTDLERENRRLQGQIRAREEIADVKDRCAYALQQVRDLSAKVPRSELHSTKHSWPLRPAVSAPMHGSARSILMGHASRSARSDTMPESGVSAVLGD
jgi:hypothetical protein